jgi:hypothetical protein
MREAVDRAADWPPSASEPRRSADRGRFVQVAAAARGEKEVCE